MGTFQQLWLNYKPRKRRHSRSPFGSQNFDWTIQKLKESTQIMLFCYCCLIIFTHYVHTHTHTQKHTPFRPCLHYHELGTLPLSPSSAYRSRFCFGQVGWSHSFGWGEEVTSSFYNFNFNAFSTAVSSYNGLSLLGKRGAGNTVGISPIRGRSIDSGSSLSCLVRNSHLRGQNIVDNFLRGFFLSFDSKYY